MLSRIKRFINHYKHIKYIAYHDTLTNTYNRNWLNDNINSIKCKYVYFIDINNLHEINKNGHYFGDIAIINTANLIINAIPKKIPIVRYGGDEFLIFSDIKLNLYSNKLFTIGFTPFVNDIHNTINLADYILINNKKYQ